MLDFVAETAQAAGLEDYRVDRQRRAQAPARPIFHLHWHVLGGRVQGLLRMSLIARHRGRAQGRR